MAKPMPEKRYLLVNPNNSRITYHKTLGDMYDTVDLPGAWFYEIDDLPIVVTFQELSDLIYINDFLEGRFTSQQIPPDVLSTKGIPVEEDYNISMDDDAAE